MRFVRKTIVMLSLGVAAPCFGLSLFPAGSENKSLGIESSLASRRGSAVLYNPANLTLSPGRKSYVELGYVNVVYSYEHPDYDPVHIAVNSPTLTLGYSGQYNNRLYFGMVFFPGERSKLAIPGVPRRIGEETYSVAVDNEALAIYTGVGVGYRLTSQLAAGLSLLYSYEKRSVKANLVGSESKLVDSQASGQFFRPRLGGYFHEGPWRVGLSYLPALKKAYKGSYESASQPGTDTPQERGYDPQTIAASASATWAGWTGQVDLNYKQWAAGRSVVKSGLGQDPEEADLRNVLERGISATYHFDRQRKLSLAYAELPSPWGDGGSQSDLSGSQGVSFGALDGISRKTFALGGAFEPLRNLQAEAALFHAQGAREVGAAKTSLGYYQISMTALSLTMSYRF